MTKKDKSMVSFGFLVLGILVLAVGIFSFSRVQKIVRMLDTFEVSASVAPVVSWDTLADRTSALTDVVVDDTDTFVSASGVDSQDQGDVPPVFKYVNFGTVDIGDEIHALFPPPYDTISVGSMLREGIVRKITRTAVFVDTWQGHVLVLENVGPAQGPEENEKPLPGKKEQEPNARNNRQVSCAGFGGLGETPMHFSLV